MSAFRLSKSQRPQESFELLHNGIRRSIDKEEYTKIFTKIKIHPRVRNQPFNSSNTNRQVIQNLQSQHERLKENIKLAQASNKELKDKISKVQKIENILFKKLDNQDINQLSLQKALEIKLLLECQIVDEEYRMKQEQFDRMFKIQRQKQQQLDIYQDQPQIELHAILYTGLHAITKATCQQEEKIQQNRHLLANIKDKTQKIREIKKAKKEQLKQFEKVIQSSRLNIPNIHKTTDQNDSVIFGTQGRAKSTTDSLQKEIETLHQQNISFEHHIQELTETKIKEKIQILKEIHNLQSIMTQESSNKRFVLPAVF